MMLKTTKQMKDEVKLGDYNSKNNVKIGIRESENGHQVQLSIGHQTFSLRELEAEEGMTSLEYAEWQAKQLRAAFSRLLPPQTEEAVIDPNYWSKCPCCKQALNKKDHNPPQTDETDDEMAKHLLIITNNNIEQARTLAAEMNRYQYWELDFSQNVRQALDKKDK